MVRLRGNPYWFGLTVLLASYGSGGAQSGGMQHGGMQHEHMKGPSAREELCRGFLVLANGYAVMSGLSIGNHGGHPMKRDGQVKQEEVKQEASHTPAMRHGEQGMAGMKHGADMEDHRMGREHGEDHRMATGRLCVPLDPSKDSWAAISGDEGIQVVATSVRGSLAHNSRENEAFELRLMNERNPLENAEVVFIARMPQHDRSMAGGHGLANDPDGKGLKATPSGKGLYIVDSADFSMPGPWLFEIRVKNGGKTSQAYFATAVGEE